MTQTTTLIATPDPEPRDEARTCRQDTCPLNVNFCDGTCWEYGDGYHASAFTFVSAKRWNRLKRAFRKTEISLTVYRKDTKKKAGKPHISLITGDLSADEISLTPTKARKFAAHLLNSADLADPLPLGESVVAASDVRMQDEILTADGWQTVNGLMLFTSLGSASVFTDERNDEDSDGWEFRLTDLVKVRRAMHGGRTPDATASGAEQETVVLAAEHVRIDDEILTDDGWQTVVRQTADAIGVAIWTDDPDCDTGPIQRDFTPGEPVSVQRNISGTDGVMWKASQPAATPELDKNSSEWLALVEKQRIREGLFDATRPPCQSWCDGTCETDGHFGDAMMHVSEMVSVPTTSSRADGDYGKAWIEIQRHDALDRPTELLVELNLTDAEGAYTECASFTPDQTRQFAAELQTRADMAQPEFELPAQDVRIADLFPVGDDWRSVYAVLVDVPSNNVQINTTVKPGVWPEVNGDEEPHSFELGTTVRIRRGVGPDLINGLEPGDA